MISCPLCGSARCVSHILQHREVGDVGIAEGHPEPRALESGTNLARLSSFVVHQVHVPGADRLEIEIDLDGHRRALDHSPFSHGAGGGHFADVDLRD